MIKRKNKEPKAPKPKKAPLKVRWNSFWERNRKSEKNYLLKKKMWDIFYRLCRGILVFGLCFLILQPLLTKISLSFMEEQDLYDSTVISIPRHFSVSSYTLAWKMLKGIKAFGTSLMLSLIVALAQVVSCTLVGYGFARFKFPLKNFWFGCVILVIIVPPQTLFAPYYIWFSNFDILGICKLLTGHTVKLLGSLWPYLLMCLGCAGYKSGLYIYLLRQHFRNEPKELEEAAYVDGCSKLRTFVQILLPGAAPIITSCFLFSFVWQWTDVTYSQLFFSRVNGWNTVTNGLSTLVNHLDTYYKSLNGSSYAISTAFGNQVLSTGMLLAIIPLLIIYVFAQKNFVESLSSTGIKG